MQDPKAMKAPDKFLAAMQELEASCKEMGYEILVGSEPAGKFHNVTIEFPDSEEVLTFKVRDQNQRSLLTTGAKILDASPCPDPASALLRLAAKYGLIGLG